MSLRAGDFADMELHWKMPSLDAVDLLRSGFLTTAAAVCPSHLPDKIALCDARGIELQQAD